MMRLLAVLLLMLMPLLPLGGALAQSVPAEGRFDNPAQEARVHELQRQLRCMVCQGQSIDESDAPLAQDLRRLVREQIATGKSNDEILAYLHARYGDFILMQPPVQPHTWLLWLIPLLVLGAGAAVAWFVIARARTLPESAESGDSA
jgi:cytochrome c-type biogenesis protein CcmH